MTLNGVGANIYYDDNYGAELESEVRTWESFLVSSDSILFTKDVNTKILFSGTQPCPAIRISEIPGTLEIAADEEQNNLVLFSLPLRVSTRVNKQLKCSFSRRVEIRNRQMEGLFHFMFDLQLQSTTNGREFNISGVCCQLSPVCMW